ncbi:protein GL2-INTERACTING REPRESSOR 1 [Rhodamnia argentea]|uniref:Protein GL2-INTERACTING REPRESSOR 1 n=1 Tax=Rhodamnia argentea TaxID=178133 RepID=A0A8B8NJ97_9MYRT|nr:protein GL2-INTERACTING REPRESSOR 1 [Rhodamnia argentea]
MSGRSAKSPGLELRLNLSPPRADGRYHLQAKDSPKSSTSSPSSCESSCVSSSSAGLEENHNSNSNNTGDDPRPAVATSMVVVGCPRCLMYVMLSEVDPKCPRCKSSVLLDFVGEDNHSTKKNRV